MVTRRYYLLVIIALWLSACASSPDKKIVISAAISLREPLQEIEKIYKSGTKITYNFGASGALQQQIEQGAPVDVFISASSKQMDALQKKNLIYSDTRTVLAANQLALVTSGKKVVSVKDLARPEIQRIAIGDPKSVPAGQYAEESLHSYQLFDTVKSKIIYGKDVRQVLTYVETGNVDAGFVYLTDAQTSNQVKIVAIIPPEAHSKIVYPLAVLQRSQNPEAKDFAKFLTSESAQSIFRKYGFVVPK